MAYGSRYYADIYVPEVYLFCGSFYGGQADIISFSWDSAQVSGCIASRGDGFTTLKATLDDYYYARFWVQNFY
jgi:hypothetical protein